jgi:TrkA domain protein
MAMDQFTITAHSPIAGMTIMETKLRSETGASIIALVKGGKNYYNPAPQTAIQPGDVMLLIGDEAQLHKARRIITGTAAP